MALSEKTRINLTFLGFLSMLAGAVSGTAIVVNSMNGFQSGTYKRFDELEKTVAKIEAKVDASNGTSWRVEDQIEYSHELKSLTGLNVPDPKKIVRERLSAGTIPRNSVQTVSISTLAVIDPSKDKTQ